MQVQSPLQSLPPWLSDAVPGAIVRLHLLSGTEMILSVVERGVDGCVHGRRMLHAGSSLVEDHASLSTGIPVSMICACDLIARPRARRGG